jgi:hypothetical protein
LNAKGPLWDFKHERIKHFAILVILLRFGAGKSELASTSPFQGFRGGDCLAPLLFDILMDALIENSKTTTNATY